MLYWDEKVRCSVFVGTAGVAPSASMVHFDDGDGDTLRVVAASGRLRTAGDTSAGLLHFLHENGLHAWPRRPV